MNTPSKDLSVREVAGELSLPVVPFRPGEHPVIIYLAKLARGSRASVRSALRIAGEILEPGRPVLELDWSMLRFKHLDALRSHLIDHGYAPKTCRRILAAVRGVLRAAWKLELMNSDDYHRAIALDAVNGERLPAGRALDADETRKLFGACDVTTVIGIRDKAILSLLFGCGLRCVELCNVNIDDLDMQKTQLRIMGKGNKQRLAHLPPGSVPLLKAWIGVRGSLSGALILPVSKDGVVRHETRYGGKPHPSRLNSQRVWSIVVSRGKDAGITKVATHDLRRTFITQLLDQGVDIARVQRLAGHASISITAGYDRRGEREAKEAAEQLEVPS